MYVLARVNVKEEFPFKVKDPVPEIIPSYVVFVPAALVKLPAPREIFPPVDPPPEIDPTVKL